MDEKFKNNVVAEEGNCDEDSAHAQISSGSGKGHHHPHMTRKQKLILSGLIWFCTFAMGLQASFLSSSLLEFSQKFQTTVPTISKVFTVMTFSFLTGALSWGFLFNYVNRQVTSALLLAVSGLAAIAIPVVPTLALFFIVVAIVGFSVAGYNCAQIVWIIELWESGAAPYIQVQHFSFALGWFFSPLMMKPFLAANFGVQELLVADPESNYSVSTTAAAPSAELGEFHMPSTDALPIANPRLYIPFLIGGLVTVLGASFILISYCVSKYEKPVAKSQPGTNGIEKSPPVKRSKAIILIALSGLVIGSYEGLEACTMQFLPAFTHFLDLHLSGPDGALVLSSLTGAFTVGRGLGIFIAFKLPTELLLLCNMILVAIGNTCLLLLANNSIGWLYTGSIILGIGFSTVFPSFYGYIEKHLEVTNLVGSVMIVSGGVVGGCYPFIIGHYIERNPLVLMYTNYFSLAICICTFSIVYVLTSRARFGFSRRTRGPSVPTPGGNRGEKERERAQTKDGADVVLLLKPVYAN